MGYGDRPNHRQTNRGHRFGKGMRPSTTNSQFMMKQYVEIGIGNTWWVRTEVEDPDGTEHEIKGCRSFRRVEGIYLRFWIGKSVWIMSTNERLKTTRRNRPAFKVLFGISGIPAG